LLHQFGNQLGPAMLLGCQADGRWHGREIQGLQNGHYDLFRLCEIILMKPKGQHSYQNQAITDFTGATQPRAFAALDKRKPHSKARCRGLWGVSAHC
jgi:hypothetical protein